MDLQKCRIHPFTNYMMLFEESLKEIIQDLSRTLDGQYGHKHKLNAKYGEWKN